MDERIDVRVLEGDADAVVARTRAGERLVVTDRGRPVARLSPVARTPLEGLLESGQARPARSPLVDLGPPLAGVGVSTELAADISAMRTRERF